MSYLSFNEIRDRAIAFMHRWQGTIKENAETQAFWHEFFTIFGVDRKRVATYEKNVKKIDGGAGRIDVFWPGTMLVEQKTAGRDLDKAFGQALDYFPGLTDKELPQYIITCDFVRFELYNLLAENDNEKKICFELSELHEHIGDFAFIAGYQKRVYREEPQVNIDAANLIADFYETLEEIDGSAVSEEERKLFTVRVLFCLFADDSGIFTPDDFYYWLKERTSEDGSNAGSLLAQLFQILNTPHEQRGKALDEAMAKFPYINGKLFATSSYMPTFNKTLRDKLIACAEFNWSKISPAVFGSLFQNVADKTKRRAWGEHYTTERNILKTIEPLFLDELRRRFESVKNNIKELKAFHQELAHIKICDPACGCGNFLVVSYRELRRLEMEILNAERSLDTRRSHGERMLDISTELRLDVDQFYGFEIDNFATLIAKTAMWLTDHQMNSEFSMLFGQYYQRIPLKKEAQIHCINVLRFDWHSLLPANLSYIVGNPPFVGARMQSKSQKEDLLAVFSGVKSAGNLDYVTAWYKKAADFLQEQKQCSVAFVSTNSISQGEQAGVLWLCLFSLGMQIYFAHRTFVWDSEAGGKAHVHCVIIGFGHKKDGAKLLYDYPENGKGEPFVNTVENINPYLLAGKDIVVLNREKPLDSFTPEMTTGNKPIDDGNYLFTENEKNNFIAKEPEAEKYFYSWLGATDLINNSKRYVLLVNRIPITKLTAMPHTLERIDNVKKFRMASKSKPTQCIASYPTSFHIENFPDHVYIAIPVTSSEKRAYIPIAFMQPSIIPSVDIRVIKEANLYLFGVLTSMMHMTWTKYTCGRLKSDYRYSKGVVYNNFPFPRQPATSLVNKVEVLAQAVLDERAKHVDASLAQLYHPLTMPVALQKAHQALDRAVDACYGLNSKALPNERCRIEFLFDEYEKIVNTLRI